MQLPVTSDSKGQGVRYHRLDKPNVIHGSGWQHALAKRKIWIAVTILLVIILRIYLWTVEKWGTLSPLAVAMYTLPLGGLTSEELTPPKGWKPKFRVVFSLTTRPGRVAKLYETIMSLANQDLPVDAIYLNLPKGKMARSNQNYDEVEIPSSLTEIPKLVINRCKDVGPLTKLYPTLLKEADPETLVITVDDDFVYPADLSATLAWQTEHKEDIAVGVCGWGTMGWSRPLGVVPVYAPYWQRPTGVYVDILQACCGIGYRRRFFENVTELADFPPVCMTVDDVWISGYLATKSKVPRAIMSKRLDPSSPQWKADEPLKGLKLSSYNDDNFIHSRCIDEIEKRYGQWKRVADYEDKDI